MIYWGLPILIAYLLGSISFSFLFAKWLRGIDIRQHGSGNAGATNTFRVLGKGPGSVVGILDALKGMAAVWIAGLLTNHDPNVMIVAGITAVAGHNWPIFLRFRGGKGIATTVGVTVMLVFKAALVAGIIAIIIIIITRYVSVGSLVLASVLPIAIAAFGTYPPVYLWVSLILTVFAFWSHRSNLKNLYHGNERKI